MSTEPADQPQLLGVFAHPDDETIGGGALLATAVAAGTDVSVVTCTRGERGEVIPPELAHLAADGTALAAHREGELSAALSELGVHRHLYLDQVPGLADHLPGRFVDSGMSWVAPGIAGPVADAGVDAFSRLDVDLAARLLAVVIRHLRPSVVLTEEPDGGYGHPDHVQTHRVTMRAVAMAADGDVGGPWPTTPDPLAALPAWQVLSVLWVAQAEEDLREAVAELERHTSRQPAPLPPDGARASTLLGADGTPLTVPELGPSEELPGSFVPRAQLAAHLDAGAVTDRVRAALHAHGTQVQAVAALPDAPRLPGGARLVGHFALSNNTLMPLLDRGYVRVAPGYDARAALAALTGDRAAGGTGRAGDLDAEPAGRGRAPRDDGAAPRAPGGEDRAYPPVGGRRVDRVVTGGGGAVATVLAAVVGGAMGLLGTVVHRYAVDGWPVGMVVALAGVLAGAVAARAVARSGGLLVAALAVVLVTQAMAFLRPGGDVLITGEPIGYVWLFGAPVAIFVAAVLPRRWFADGRPARTAEVTR